MRVSSAAARAALTLLAVGCAETSEQHAARRAVVRVANPRGDTHCSSDPSMFFAQGPTASVFVCIVRADGGTCDRYVVHRSGDRYAVRLQERDADCILLGQ